MAALRGSRLLVGSSSSRDPTIANTHSLTRLRLSFDAGEPRAFHPKPLGGVVVLRLQAGRDLPALIKISAAHIGDLGGAGEMDDRLRSLLRLAGEQHREPDEEGEGMRVAPAEPGGDEARVQAVDGHAGACPAARELAREQDIAKLAAAVCLEA